MTGSAKYHALDDDPMRGLANGYAAVTASQRTTEIE